MMSKNAQDCGETADQLLQIRLFISSMITERKLNLFVFENVSQQVLLAGAKHGCCYLVYSATC